MEPCKTFLLNKIFKRNLNFLKTQAALFLTNSELIEIFKCVCFEGKGIALCY